MSRAYAEGTSVPVDRSKGEIDALLSKHGATQRGIVADDADGRAMVAFVIGGRHYRLDLPMPKLSDMPDPTKGTWQLPKGTAVHARWNAWSPEQRRAHLRDQLDQRCRERWRAVVLMLKAKLELVRIGVSTVEKEFMSDLVIRGRTVGQMLEEQMEQLLQGEAPRLLPEST